MANLIRKGTREVVEVAPGDVYKYLRSGEFNIPSDLVSDGRLEMVANNGEVVKVALKDVQDAFKHGYNLEDTMSREGRELEKEYSGFLPGLTSAGLGAAKGLSFGLSSPLLSKLGVDVEAYEAFRPDEFVAGDIAGSVAGIVGTGGYGALVRGGAKMAAKSGAQATAKMAEKTFGQKLMKKAASGAIEGTIDGALYGTGEAIHQIGLQKAELTGQTLASTIGSGAATGLAIGGGLGFASVPIMSGIRNYAAPAMKAVAKSLPITLPTHVTSAEGFFNQISKDAGYESLGPMLKDERLINKKWTPEQIEAAKTWLKDTTVDGVPPIQAGETWEEIAEKLGQKREEVGQRLGEFTRRVEESSPEGFGLSHEELITRLTDLSLDRKVIPTTASKNLRDSAEEAITNVKKVALINDLERNLLLDATYGTNRTLKRIEEYAKLTNRDLDDIMLEVKRHREAGKDLTEDLDLQFGREKVGPDEVLETEAAVGRLGQDLDDALGIERNLSPMEDLVRDMIQDIHRLTDADIGAIYKGSKNLHPISIIEGHLAKKSYWDKSRFDRVAASEIPDYAKKVGGIWRDVLDEASDDIIQNWRKWGRLGEDVIGDLDVNDFRRLKREYGYADTFHSIAKDRAFRSTVNSQTSMSGLLMTATGAILGTTGGGPWGGAIGATIGAATTKYLKENGTSLTHAGARFMSKLASVRNGKIDDIAKRASAIVKGTAKRSREVGLPVTVKALTSLTFTGAPLEGDTKPEKLHSLVNQIESVASNPQMFATMVESELHDLNVVAPLVAQEVMKTKVRAMKLLNEKSPKRSGSYSNYQPKLYQKSEIDPMAMSQFERYLGAVLDFTGTLFDDLSDGTLMQETVEVGEKVYPEMLREIRTVMAKDLSDTDKAYPNSFMAQLNTLFGEGVVPYQNPDFMRRQQQQYKVESKGSMKGLKPSSASQGRTELLMQTDVNAVQSNLRSNKFA
jgi:hypothetical protein|tara:strand:+ start:3214 stop:6105 length:2892 start_codon:yes stop_codon:yes gene_type:complete